MREFTKEHNDLRWLFPIAESEKAAESIFDEMEEQGKYLFKNAGYDEKDEDLAIDCFLKGASSAMQMYLSVVYKDICDRIYENVTGVGPFKLPELDENGNQTKESKKQTDKYYRYIFFKEVLERAACIENEYFKFDEHDKKKFEKLRSLIENTEFDWEFLHKKNKDE